MMAESMLDVELHCSSDVLKNSVNPPYADSTQTNADPDPAAESNQRQPKSMEERFTAKPERRYSSEGSTITHHWRRRDKRKEKRGRKRRNRAQQLNDYNERLVARHMHNEIRIQDLKRQIKLRWLQDVEFLARRLHSRAHTV
ncbi:uncharacterized protein N7506_000271 [Penicillium brevicompactum]|uniref:uncharacterized protein n=1 Tax=Penicillium brevicompactum TaxID=5074 RepID=UPI0025424584|nr:uncharacterized protein N7506_000271 [Penicillium brevicompactum]KAJ5347018.1 hypothetical protein N7506_000271 [Penicillium brevicompactum]